MRLALNSFTPMTPHTPFKQLPFPSTCACPEPPDPPAAWTPPALHGALSSPHNPSVAESKLQLSKGMTFYLPHSGYYPKVTTLKSISALDGELDSGRPAGEAIRSRQDPAGTAIHSWSQYSGSERGQTAFKEKQADSLALSGSRTLGKYLPSVSPRLLSLREGLAGC